MSTFEENTLSQKVPVKEEHGRTKGPLRLAKGLNQMEHINKNNKCEIGYDRTTLACFK